MAEEIVEAIEDAPKGEASFMMDVHTFLVQNLPFIASYVDIQNHLARDRRFQFFSSFAIYYANAYINIVEQDVEQEESTKVVAMDDAINIEEALTKIVMNLDSCKSFNGTLINSCTTRHVISDKDKLTIIKHTET